MSRILIPLRHVLMFLFSRPDFVFLISIISGLGIIGSVELITPVFQSMALVQIGKTNDLIEQPSKLITRLQSSTFQRRVNDMALSLGLSDQLLAIKAFSVKDSDLVEIRTEGHTANASASFLEITIKTLIADHDKIAKYARMKLIDRLSLMPKTVPEIGTDFWLDWLKSDIKIRNELIFDALAIDPRRIDEVIEANSQEWKSRLVQLDLQPTKTVGGLLSNQKAIYPRKEQLYTLVIVFSLFPGIFAYFIQASKGLSLKEFS